MTLYSTQTWPRLNWLCHHRWSQACRHSCRASLALTLLHRWVLGMALQQPDKWHNLVSDMFPWGLPFHKVPSRCDFTVYVKCHLCLWRGKIFHSTVSVCRQVSTMCCNWLIWGIYLTYAWAKHGNFPSVARKNKNTTIALKQNLIKPNWINEWLRPLCIFYKCGTQVWMPLRHRLSQTR